MAYRRMIELLAVLMIGDSVVAFLRPRRYLRLWDCGPDWLRSTALFFARNRQATRTLALVELAAGVWLALRETEL